MLFRPEFVPSIRPQSEVFLVVLPIAPVERLLFALGAAIIGVPLMIGLTKIGIIVGPKMYK